MNKERLARLRKARDEVESVKDEEQDAYDNLPDAIQNGERGEKMQENVAALDEALIDLDGVLDDHE